MAAILFVVSLGTAVYAQESWTDDTWRLDVGGWLMTFDTGAELNSLTYGRGTDIDLENDLNLDDDKTVFRLSGYWRFLPDHRLEFGYMQASRSSSASLDRVIDWNEYTFDVGAYASVNAKVRQYRLNYMWSFYHTPNQEAGLLLGLNYMTFETDLAAQGRVYWKGNGKLVGARVDRSASLDAPVPVIGFFWEYYFNEDWKLNARVDGFSVTVGDVKGDIFEGRISLDWYFSRNVGFGLGYDISRIEVKDKGGDPEYRADWNTDGVMAYFSFKF